ncbi:MAG: alpha/beta hydrolase [Kofleriaceae bacterium]
MTKLRPIVALLLAAVSGCTTGLDSGDDVVDCEGGKCDSADDKSDLAVDELRAWLTADPATRGALGDQPFATLPLSREASDAAKQLLWDDHVATIRATRLPEIEQLALKHDEVELKLFLKTFGNKPANGRSLWISMHGGGAVAPEFNDQQWRNQQALYSPAEGIYVAPRAPTDTSAMWHAPHIDPLFDRLIEDLIVFADVDPNRVYLMGYSAGGDGAYQVAPRMADRYAAAAMMAGHPNNASPVGLRNLPFTGHVGELDTAYDRNLKLVEWGHQMDALQVADPAGYTHMTQVHPGKSHWMDNEDAVAVPWMAGFTRDPFPKRVVWRQDEVTHGRFYWLAVDQATAKLGDQVSATIDGQQIVIESSGIAQLTIRANDQMLDLDKPVVVLTDGTQRTANPVRTIATLAKTLGERGDPTSVFSTEWTIDVKK